MADPQKPEQQPELFDPSEFTDELFDPAEFTDANIDLSGLDFTPVPFEPVRPSGRALIDAGIPKFPQSSAQRHIEESQGAYTSGPDAREGAKFVAEVAPVAIAGMLAGPPGAVPTEIALGGKAAMRAWQARELIKRMAFMGTAGALGAAGGNVISPPASQREMNERMAQAFNMNAAGEPLVAGGLGLAREIGPPAWRHARQQAAKAGGFIFSSLSRAGREEAERVGGEMLRNKVIRWWPASAETLLSRAEDVQSTASRRLENLREQMDLHSPGASTREIQRELKRVLGGNQATLQDIIPGSPDEAALMGMLNEARQYVRSYARQGAKSAPRIGPEGDVPWWNMTRGEAAESALMSPSAGAPAFPRMGPGSSEILPTPLDELLGELRGMERAGKFRAPGSGAGGLESDQLLGIERDLGRQRNAVIEAIRAGQQVPGRVLAEDAGFGQFYPNFMNASTIAANKKKFADLAYAAGNRGRSAETIQGEMAPLWEDARGVLQGAEEGLAQSAGVLPQFKEAKDTYGAMERLTNINTGVTEAAANRALGNNQVFNLTNQLAAMAGRPGSGPLEAGMRAAIARFAFLRLNQTAAKNAEAAAMLANAIAKRPEVAAALTRTFAANQGTSGETGLGDFAVLPPEALVRLLTFNLGGPEGLGLDQGIPAEMPQPIQ